MFEELIPSLLITFREALEATLMVAIIVSYLKKIGKPRLSRYAYLGTGAAISISLGLGFLIQVVYGGMNEVTAELFEGFASLIAVVVLTYMIFWMTEHSKNIKGDMQQKLDVTISRGEIYGIASLAFFAIFREGLETVLFLSTPLIQDATGTLIGVVVGASAVLVLAVLLIRGTYSMDLRKFFGVTSILLVVFAAGLAGYGVHELIEAGENLGYDFGVMAAKPFDINPPVNLDGSYPLLHEKGLVGSVLKALVGYDGNPEWLRILVYFSYWAIIGTYLYWNYKKTWDTQADPVLQEAQMEQKVIQ